MIQIVPYRETWPAAFRELGAQLRNALGSRASAIHHIGSTAVPGLPAKDIIDVQVTVEAIGPWVKDLLKPLGLEWVEKITTDHAPAGINAGPTDLRKMFFKRRSSIWANVHLRETGRINQRYALLFRDYLRSNEQVCAAYAQLKRQLARYFPENLEGYCDIKDPACDIIMAGAERWAGETGWVIPPSDA